MHQSHSRLIILLSLSSSLTPNHHNLPQLWNGKIQKARTTSNIRTTTPRLHLGSGAVVVRTLAASDARPDLPVRSDASLRSMSQNKKQVREVQGRHKVVQELCADWNRCVCDLAMLSIYVSSILIPSLHISWCVSIRHISKSSTESR